MSTVTEVSASAHSAAAPARMALYGRLAELFSFPTPDLIDAYVSGALRDELEQLSDAVPYTLPLEGGLRVGRGDGISSDYIRIFDVPSGGSTCPLYGGVLTGDRRQVMEDLLRMYRHFGLTTANAELGDLPDSIPTVLEFLGFLTYRECEASDGDLKAVRRAQRDLLDRYLARWAPIVVERVAALDPPPIYADATLLLEGFVVGELQALVS